MKQSLIKISATLMLLWTTQVDAQPENFLLKLKDRGAFLSTPINFRSVPKEAESPVDYELAIEHPTEKYQLRFALFDASKEMSKSSDLEEAFQVEFDRLIEKLNNSGTPVISRHLDAHEVPKFDAETGRYAMLRDLSPKFSKFKNCLVVGITKKNKAQLFLFHLFDDQKATQKLVQENFYDLRFGVGKVPEILLTLYPLSSDS